MDDNKVIYRLDERISFRTCSLFHGEQGSHGDCTNFYQVDRNWNRYYGCNQEGIHFHCTEHPGIELEKNEEFGSVSYSCPKCKNVIQIHSEQGIRNRCFRMLNIPEFKKATLIRLDDWYVPEVKKKDNTETGYWIKTEVKTDKDSDTMIVIYVGCKGQEGKTQYFIKPEKMQLSSDHKDLDPSTIISRIQVTLKDRELIQDYDE